MCVHCGQLSEVTRPHPCVGCGGIISNTLEAFLYYDNSICLSCYTGAEALHIYKMKFHVLQMKPCVFVCQLPQL